MEHRPKLLLADDHRIFAESLRKLLTPDFEVITIVDDGEALLRALNDESLPSPEIIICDLSMPKMGGLEAIRQLTDQDSNRQVIVLSMHAESRYVEEAFRAGARGYVVKSAAADELLTAIREVLTGRYFVSPEVTKFLVGAAAGAAAPHTAKQNAAGTEKLTQREIEIVRLVAKGLSNQEVAREIHLAETTVRTHLKRIFKKLDLGNRVELTVYGIRAGWVDLDAADHS